ncbi:Cytochrome P450 [Amycolatopsis tolypomycina]|uniref:Cytochrome P450 n=1 Tax=Amycolatopsis tolypomycina TaxID=208445 RepID=A0A1H4VX95_9PSEU|nr:cytochrome P450 [Amycolatopsis tolypomycina]SEC85011.1 Cytochrome P450 [Amycolatopsis tolypomycina]
MTCPWGNTDLVDHGLYSDGDPHGIWREQRRHDPVSWQEPGFWSVTRYEDVCTVLRAPGEFTSEQGTLLNLLGKGDPASGSNLVTTDPPRHTRMRNPIQRALSIREAEHYRPRIRELVAELLAPLGDGGPFDFAAAMSRVPMAVTGTLMGLPRFDWSRLSHLAMSALAPDDPKYRLPSGPEATLQAAHREIFTYFQDLVSERRADPGHDLIGTLLTMDVDGDTLSLSEIMANCHSLLVGAIVTTPQVPTATLLELAGKDVLDDWAGSPGRMKRALEEALRWASPSNHFMRHATRDVDLAGVTIRAGDPVVVWLGSANRDEDVFPDPYTFDITRNPNRHVAFGIGPHFCIGHSIARVTLQAVFAELLGRFTDFEVVAPPRRLRSNIIAGITELPVTARRRPTPAPITHASGG